MQAKWVIEDDAFPEDMTPLLDALKRQGIEYKTVQYQHSCDICLELYPGEDCVIFQGSLRLARQLRKKAKWIPGVYYNVPKYECIAYYAHLGKYLVNGNYIMLPFGELLRQKEFLFEHLSCDRAIFLRPSRGDKIFTGQIVYKEKYEDTIDRFGFGQIDPEEVVVVAEPRNIAAEWRFIVVDGKIITGSQYKENDRVAIAAGYPVEAFDLASRIVCEYNHDQAFVVDICLTKSGIYALMEVGCFSCAGLYQCDRDVIVKSVSEAAVKEWQSYSCCVSGAGASLITLLLVIIFTNCPTACA